MYWKFINGHLAMMKFWFAWMKPANSISRKHGHLYRQGLANLKNMILNMNVTGSATFLYPHGALVLSAPLEGWRHVKVTDHHAKVDFAQAIKELVDDHYPEKKKIVLVIPTRGTSG
jgi:hypothetical protein